MNEKMLNDILGIKPQIEEFNLQLDGMADAIQEIRTAQEETGSEKAPCRRIKVSSGGLNFFTVKTGDENDNERPVSEFRGVILHNHRCNARFAEDADYNSPPLCSSDDAVIGYARVDGEKTGEAFECDTCPYNQYGSSSKGGGKACKNMHRLYIMVEGSPVPYILSVPPTSLKYWKDYRVSTLAANQIKPSEAVTGFTLKTKDNAKKIKYAVIQFKLLGKLPEHQRSVVALMAGSVSKPAEITGDDYNREALPAASEETANAD